MERIISPMSDTLIYLDNNATAPIVPEVSEAMSECARCQHANPASQHRPGRRARRILEDARETVAQRLGAKITTGTAARLIFTSGATEANNLALYGLAGSPPGRIILSAIEHPSVWRAGEFLAQQGFDVRTLAVDRQGVVRLDLLADLIDEQTRLVSVIWANHETGALQPLVELAAICKRFGVLLHTDAVQAAGKIPIAFDQLGIAALTISAHKFHGPPGIGALLLRHDTPLQPLLRGGFQQGGLRPGTESVELAVGLQVALDRSLDHNLSDEKPLASLRDQLEQRLCELLPDLVIHSRQVARSPHTSQISFLGTERQAVVMALDQVGVACATGTACESGSSEPSRTLLAMGCEQTLLESAVRLSVGTLNTASEMDRAAERIAAKIKQLRRLNNRYREAEPARRGV